MKRIGMVVRYTKHYQHRPLKLVTILLAHAGWDYMKHDWVSTKNAHHPPSRYVGGLPDYQIDNKDKARKARLSLVFLHTV